MDFLGVRSVGSLFTTTELPPHQLKAGAAVLPARSGVKPVTPLQRGGAYSR